MCTIGKSSLMRNGQRVGVFFDSNNQFPAAKEAFAGSNLDHRAVLNEASGGRCLVIANAYVVDDGTTSKKRWVYSLECAGYRVRSKDLRVFMNGEREGDWDVGIVVDVMNYAAKLDIVVLVAGDGDYLPLVEDLQQSGHYVVVMSFKSTLSAALRQTADEVILLDDPRFCYRGNSNSDTNGTTPHDSPVNPNPNLGEEPVKT